jgi:hypothetical protein
MQPSFQRDAMTHIQTILIFIAALQAKHFICDGPLQSKAMVEQKRIYGAALGLVHAGLHGLGTATVSLLWLGPTPRVLALGLIDAALHYHVDFAKENMVRHYGWSVKDGPFWWAMSADQMLHQWTYVGLAALSFSA